ncbi:3-hydroxyacyl-ACP dehydratase FabZ [Desulfococcaceae bacterium HSG7]|nr:3-hydroxyacyl-ACP dehydratase FabZ [Desulfococcaceae bacterium HSG9]MDM8554497.1 3-hydroxyacyl-ACP dehydratase FabZ [Desulfococcaceae bacterium HSG7]
MKNNLRKEYNINEISELLPHAYPFLLIDRIFDITPGESLSALKNVTINEPFFQGHFPKNPIMPGVLIVEAMAQAGAMLLHASLPDLSEKTLIYFMGMDKVKFRKPVVPGDQLILQCRFLKRRGNAAKMASVAYVNEIVVVEAELMAGYGEKND